MIIAKDAPQTTGYALSPGMNTPKGCLTSLRERNLPKPKSERIR